MERILTESDAQTGVTFRLSVMDHQISARFERADSPLAVFNFFKPLHRGYYDPDRYLSLNLANWRRCEAFAVRQGFSGQQLSKSRRLVAFYLGKWYAESTEV